MHTPTCAHPPTTSDHHTPACRCHWAYTNGSILLMTRGLCCLPFGRIVVCCACAQIRSLKFSPSGSCFGLLHAGGISIYSYVPCKPASFVGLSDRATAAAPCKLSHPNILCTTRSMIVYNGRASAMLVRALPADFVGLAPRSRLVLLWMWQGDVSPSERVGLALISVCARLSAGQVGRWVAVA